MSITTKEVQRIAELAHLEYSPEELEHFVSQFQEILDYFTQLEEVSTDEVDPTYHALQVERLQTPMRDDQVKSSFPAKKALENAPDRVDEYFKVPAVIE